MIRSWSIFLTCWQCHHLWRRDVERGSGKTGVAYFNCPQCNNKVEMRDAGDVGDGSGNHIILFNGATRGLSVSFAD